MKKKIDLFSTICVALFLAIYLLAEYGTVSTESWANPFAGGYPFAIGFGVLAIILQLISWIVERKASK